MAQNPKVESKLQQIKKVLENHKTMLIVMQDNPDPDSIASAVALRRLVNGLGGIRCTIAHGGTVGRAENQELVHYLELALRSFQDVDRGRFDLIALVDTQPGTGNNPLPPGLLPDIVIDHHPVRRLCRSVRFTDIRSRYGATSTILWEYLTAGRIAPDKPLATALLYGIRSDTQDLDQETTDADVRAVTALYPLANKRMLGQIQRGRVPLAYYQMLTDAMTSARMYGRCVVSRLGMVDNPDMIGEVADLLLRYEGVDWSLCYGFYGGQALLSLRTQDTARHAGDVARLIVRRIGTGGGHAVMAGGQIPLRDGAGGKAYRDKIETLILHRFLDGIKVRGRRGRRLVHPLARERGGQP